MKRAFGDGVELYFPPGEYLLDPITLHGTGWSLVGDDATLIVPGTVASEYLVLGGGRWRMDGFTVDLTADGAAPVTVMRGTDWQFRNVRFVGQMDDPQPRDTSSLLYPAVAHEDATGLVENVSAMDGSANPGESSNRGLTWFGANNKGKMTWRGCRFSGWANNTLYTEESNGPVVIEDCLFENTNVGVRIGGDTTVRNCTWRQTGPVPIQRWTGDASGRGIWINGNQYWSGPIEIEGCEFLMTGPDATGAIYASHRVDDLTVRNTYARQHNRESAVELPGTGTTTIRSLTVTGDTPRPAIDLVDRDGSTIADVCVRKPGKGIRIAHSANCRIERSTVDVDGTPFVFVGSDVATRGISRSGTCPTPDRTLSPR
ncbi:MAG: right-handed parallel beta-helix repeat-containing protein [Halorientalis sp.]